MIVELSENNKEYVEELLVRLNEKYPGCKWTVDEIVNGILFNYFFGRRSHFKKPFKRA